MSGYVQANTNGRLHDASEASVSPLDRGFLYGDAVYEVWRTYGGVLFAFDEHYERLQSSAGALHFELGFERQQLFAEIKRTSLAFRAHTGHRGELYVRLQVTRGAGPIGLDARPPRAPSWVLLVQSLRAERGGESGLALHIATALRRNPKDSLNPAWKTGNYLNNLLCLREAHAAGADEVLMLDHQDRLTEASTSNVFFIEQGTLWTPPVSVGILAGVTRELILRQVAPRAGLSTREEALRAEDLPRFGECFLSSTTRDITPVASIGEQRFLVGPRSITARLEAAFGEHARELARAHPERAI